MLTVDLINRPNYRSLAMLSVVPIVLSLLYFVTVNEQAAHDWVFFVLFFGTLTTVIILLSTPLNMHLFVRFGIGIMVCALFNRNIYLIVLHHFNPIAASITSQSLNLVFSYFINQYFTYPAAEDNRKIGGGTRSFFYALAFVGEISMHAFVSTNLLRIVSPFWAWFLTGAIITPYSLLVLKVIFGTKKN